MSRNIEVRRVGETIEDVSVEKYDPGIFEGLNLFHTSKILLSENSYLIRNLGDVIVRHGLQEQLGISLLHKHFDLYRDEILLRKIHPEERVAYTRPTRKHLDAVPYLWKFARSTNGDWRLVPLEFIRKGDDPTTSSINMNKLEPFLVDMANTLEELNLVDTFGIGTMNLNKIRIDENDLLVETTDCDKRLLTFSVQNRGNVKNENLTETYWSFTAGAQDETAGTVSGNQTAGTVSGNQTAGTVSGNQTAGTGSGEDVKGIQVCSGTHCEFHCRSHCSAHCRQHCVGHPRNGKIAPKGKKKQIAPKGKKIKTKSQK